MIDIYEYQLYCQSDICNLEIMISLEVIIFSYYRKSNRGFLELRNKYFQRVNYLLRKAEKYFREYNSLIPSSYCKYFS